MVREGRDMAARAATRLTRRGLRPGLPGGARVRRAYTQRSLVEVLQPAAAMRRTAVNVLRLRLDPDRMSPGVNVNGVGDPFALDSVEFDHDLAPQELSAHARLILGVLAGDPTHSIRGDEAEESWRIVEPILGAWGAGRVPLGRYPASPTTMCSGTTVPSSSRRSCAAI